MSWNYAPYFTEDEMRCRCGCGRLAMNDGTMVRFYRFREEWGRPIFVSSACRCELHPKEMAKPLSRTLRPHIGVGDGGNAVDSMILPEFRYAYIELAIKHGFTGIGVYSWGVHLDDVPVGDLRPRIW